VTPRMQAKILPAILIALMALLVALPTVKASHVQPYTICHDSDEDTFYNWADAMASIEGPSRDTSAGGGIASGGAGFGCTDPFLSELTLCVCSDLDGYYYRVEHLPCCTSDSLTHFFGTGEAGLWVMASASICKANAGTAAWLSGFCSLCRGGR